ncbi:hypothetical protein UF75_5411 [Desulfosporosinus sp. I2]|nr:hypothetical protein UF75_5411 [Desulfosporosinus sp. I2]
MHTPGSTEELLSLELRATNIPKIIQGIATNNPITAYLIDLFQA